MWNIKSSTHLPKKFFHLLTVYFSPFVNFGLNTFRFVLYRIQETTYKNRDSSQHKEPLLAKALLINLLVTFLSCEHLFPLLSSLCASRYKRMSLTILYIVFDGDVNWSLEYVSNTFLEECFLFLLWSKVLSLITRNKVAYFSTCGRWDCSFEYIRSLQLQKSDTIPYFRYRRI